VDEITPQEPDVFSDFETAQKDYEWFITKNRMLAELGASEADSGPVQRPGKFRSLFSGNRSRSL